MKNINEQVNRIKQLFTEERLHGNLVEDDNDKVLTEQEKQKKNIIEVQKEQKGNQRGN